MKSIVITSCTNRKRYAAQKSLRARDLPLGPLTEVAENWLSRITTAEPDELSLKIYCGRPIREAEKAAAHFDTEPYIISAGLGLVPPTQKIPSYDLTLSQSSKDNVLKRFTDKPDASQWWKAITKNHKDRCLSNTLKRFSGGIILIAVPQAYCHMIEDEILELPMVTRNQIRIFGPQNPNLLAPEISSLVMPYDHHFDGPDSPIPGTKTDFAQRTLRHFVSDILTEQNVLARSDEHCAKVAKLMAKFAPPQKVIRTPKSDDEIIELVRKYWKKAEGQSGKMLRVMRDDLRVACEQSRFAQLFKDAKERYSL